MTPSFPDPLAGPRGDEPRGLGFLFPGQGSQAIGMGRGLADTHAVARETLAEAGDILGFGLSRLMFEGPLDELTETRNAQPALLAHGIAVARVLAAAGARPGIAAGHSLGEFTALVAGGALEFAHGLRLVRLRGELMHAAGAARRGAMAAVLGLDDADVDEICREASAGGEVVVAANLNAPGQVVVSGDEPAVRRAVELARGRNARRVVPLVVSGAFHSPLMLPAADGLRRALDEVPLRRPAVPVVSNVTAEPASTGAEIRRLLGEQLTSPVRWHACMLTMVRLGFRDFVECGPGRVLAGLARRVEGVRSSLAAGESEEIAAVLEAVAA